MKLLKSIAAVAVLGTSFITANPAEARNGWLKVGTSTNGNTYYVKPVEYSGRYRKFLGKSSHTNSTFKNVADCSGWRWRFEEDRAWEDVMPGSLGEDQIKLVCR